MGEHYEQYITTNFMIHTMRLNEEFYNGLTLDDERIRQASY